jgi:hypothetical protein
MTPQGGGGSILPNGRPPSASGPNVGAEAIEWSGQ